MSKFPWQLYALLCKQSGPRSLLQYHYGPGRCCLLVTSTQPPLEFRCDRPSLWRVLSFLSSMLAVFKSVAHNLLALLSFLTWVCAVRNDDLGIWVVLSSVDPGSSSDGMTDGLEPVEQRSKDQVKWGETIDFWRELTGEIIVWETIEIQWIDLSQSPEREKPKSV